jgi:hypothetical protein
MCKKSFILTVLVLAAVLLGSTLAQAATEVQRRSWWSDLEPANHLWSEPNNWWTIDVHFLDSDGDGGLDSGETVWYVKADQNEVPDVNIAALVGKGEAHIMYPVELRNMILDGYVMTDPTIDGTVIAEANYVLCGGGTSFDHYWTGNGSVADPDINNWDPNFHHYLTMTGGELTIGTPQTWEGYEVVWWGDMFNGQFGSGRLCVGSVPWDPCGASGTMTMSGGTVNVGGHMEIGAWGGTGTLDMTGGTINIVQGIYCPTSWWSGTGYLNLHGGTINARYIRMTEDSYGGNIGIIDITEGKMIFEQDEEDKLIVYADYENLGSTGNILNITSYDVNHGEIIADVNWPAQVGKRAALVIDYDVSNEGKTTLAAATPTEPAQAWNPSPADDAQSVRGPAASITRPFLSWSAGDGAISHDVYFGTSFAEVDSAGTGSDEYKTTTTDVNYTVETDLEPFDYRYWRIDENPGPVKGQVWGFKMADLAKASSPSPGNGATDISPVTALSWTPGIYAVSHDVYLSSDLGPNSYTPAAFDLETTYYWRVDEVNSGGFPWPGDVWEFTAADHVVVEDFDSYANNDELWAVWPDYFYADTKAEIYLNTDPNFLIDGKSVKFIYDNDAAGSDKRKYSEIEVLASNLGTGSDWTISGLKALVLNFYGLAGNSAQPLYFAVEDSSANVGVATYDDANGTQEESWHEWNIDLEDFNGAGVDLTDVYKVYLGVGVRGEMIPTGEPGGGEGDVYFDDFRLYPTRCVGAYSYGFGDIDGDCAVNYYDLEIMGQDWLIYDYNTLGYAGTLIGFDDPDTAWSPGVDNGALYFPGIVDVNGDLICGENLEEPIPDYSSEYPGYVKIPPIGLNSNTVTMTAWIKTDGPQCEYGTGIIFIRADSASGLNLFNRDPNDELAYHWNDQHWGFESGLFVPENTWTFVALVVTPGLGTLYMDSTAAYDTEGTWGEEPFADPLWIGKDFTHTQQARYLKGWIDDVRVYDYSLTESQIEYVRTFGFSGMPTTSDPFSWYKLDETSGTNTEDSGSGQTVYWPVTSKANFVDPEPQYQRAVNFRDYCIIADSWLEEILFPPQ